MAFQTQFKNITTLIRRFILCIALLVCTVTPAYTQGWTHFLSDLAGTNFYKGDIPSVVTGYPEESWQYALPAYDISYILSGDVDGDGMNEVVTVQADVLYIFAHDGSLQSSTTLPVGNTFAYATILEDADNDGVLDIGISSTRGDSNTGDQQFLIYDGTGAELYHIIKPGSSDGGTEISTIIDGDAIVRYSAGFSRDPRGFARWDLATSTEIWAFDIGPRYSSSYSYRDIDNDGSLELSTGTWTPHNGASGNGTTDGDAYTIIVDESGVAELVQKYPGSGSSDGGMSDHLIQFREADPFQLLTLKSHYSSYPGTAKIHIRDLSGTIVHTFTGGYNQSWRYAVGDLDGDGVTDIVAGGWVNSGSGDMYVLDETLQVKATGTTTGLHFVRAIADLNGDGEMEVISYTRTGDIIAYDADLNEVWRWSTPDGSSLYNVIVSDNDNNGRLDVTALSNTHVFTLQGVPTIVDSDNDGYTDDEEIACGTDPYDAASFPAGTVSGTVTAGGIAQAGIIVKALDAADPTVVLGTGITDGTGAYAIPGVAQGEVVVMVVEPLGFTAPANDFTAVVVCNVTSGGLDFTLDTIVLVNDARTASYWKNEFDIAVRGGTPAEDLDAVIAEIQTRFTDPHFNALFAGLDTVLDWQAVFSRRPGSVTERATAEVAALVMNVMALKISQFEEVTADGFTAADVITYTASILEDGDDSNDGTAKLLAQQVNRHQLIAAGQVTAGNIAYKRNDAENRTEKTIAGVAESPDSFALNGNYPNPFNPQTTIQYSVAESAHVTVTVYDALGRHIATLVDGVQAPGYHEVAFDAANLPSGTYLYRLESPAGSETKTMLLLK